MLAPGEAGGLESVARMLAVGQRSRGHHVRVATILDDDRAEHPFVRSLREAGVETIPLVTSTRSYRRERAAMADVCREFGPGIVHTHGYRADVLDAGVARRLGIPTVTTVHGFAGGGWKNRLYERLQQFAFRRFSAVVAVSRPLVERLAASGVRRDRIHLVPNAHSPTRLLDRRAARRALSVPEDQFLVGWVGRLSQEKGADVLVDAVARLMSAPLRVSVLGDGVERAALEARAAARHVHDRITWHGVVDNASSLFRAFDVFVLSSRTEGTPIVLFEAMFARVPIVATRVGGVPDMLASTEALLVPPNDSAALAEAVLRVYRDPDSLACQVRAAAARLETGFQTDRWHAQYEDIYRRIQTPAAETDA